MNIPTIVAACRLRTTDPAESLPSIDGSWIDSANEEDVVSFAGVTVTFDGGNVDVHQFFDGVDVGSQDNVSVSAINASLLAGDFDTIIPVGVIVVAMKVRATGTEEFTDAIEITVTVTATEDEPQISGQTTATCTEPNSPDLTGLIVTHEDPGEPLDLVLTSALIGPINSWTNQTLFGINATLAAMTGGWLGEIYSNVFGEDTITASISRSGYPVADSIDIAVTITPLVPTFSSVPSAQEVQALDEIGTVFVDIAVSFAGSSGQNIDFELESSNPDDAFNGSFAGSGTIGGTLTYDTLVAALAGAWDITWDGLGERLITIRTGRTGTGEFSDEQSFYVNVVGPAAESDFNWTEGQGNAAVSSGLEMLNGADHYLYDTATVTIENNQPGDELAPSGSLSAPSWDADTGVLTMVYDPAQSPSPFWRADLRSVGFLNENTPPADLIVPTPTKCSFTVNGQEGETSTYIKSLIDGATIFVNDGNTIEQIQTEFDAAFGAGKFIISGTSGIEYAVEAAIPEDDLFFYAPDPAQTSIANYIIGQEGEARTIIFELGGIESLRANLVIERDYLDFSIDAPSGSLDVFAGDSYVHVDEAFEIVSDDYEYNAPFVRATLEILNPRAGDELTISGFTGITSGTYTASFIELFGTQILTVADWQAVLRDVSIRNTSSLLTDPSLDGERTFKYSLWRAGNTVSQVAYKTINVKVDTVWISNNPIHSGNAVVNDPAFPAYALDDACTAAFNYHSGSKSTKFILLDTIPTTVGQAVVQAFDRPAIYYTFNGGVKFQADSGTRTIAALPFIHPVEAVIVLHAVTVTDMGFDQDFGRGVVAHIHGFNTGVVSSMYLGTDQFTYDDGDGGNTGSDVNGNTGSTGNDGQPPEDGGPGESVSSTGESGGSGTAASHSMLLHLYGDLNIVNLYGAGGSGGAGGPGGDGGTVTAGDGGPGGDAQDDGNSTLYNGGNGGPGGDASSVGGQGGNGGDGGAGSVVYLHDTATVTNSQLSGGSGGGAGGGGSSGIANAGAGGAGGLGVNGGSDGSSGASGSSFAANGNPGIGGVNGSAGALVPV